MTKPFDPSISPAVAATMAQAQQQFPAGLPGLENIPSSQGWPYNSAAYGAQLAGPPMQRYREMTIDELLLENRVIFLVGEINYSSATGIIMRLLHLQNQKKGQDNTSQVTTHLRAPVMFAGESLGMSTQKALIDRCVALTAPSPVNRMSPHDPTRPQLHDIREFRQRYPDRTVFAGAFVTMALRYVDDAISVVRESHGSTRADQKGAVLRAGAVLLRKMTGDASHEQRVDRWVERKPSQWDWENELTTNILPRLLSATGNPSRWDEENLGALRGRVPFAPVIAVPDKGTGGYVVMFQPEAVAQAWEMLQHGRINTRTQSLDAISQQIRAVPSEHLDKNRLSVKPGLRKNVQACSALLSERVVQRAGTDPDVAVGM